MDSKEIQFRLESMLEQLAAVEHQRWAHWQSYLHSVCVKEADGSLRIPSELVQQWERQIQTEYSDLTDPEKESDREQVRKYFPLIVRALIRSG